MRPFLKPTVTIFLLIGFYTALCAQHHRWIHPYVPLIDSLFANNQRGSYPGLAVGVVKGGQLMLAKGYGLANLEHGLPFTPNTISDIGSLAKQMTCFAMVLLAQNKQLSLDDNIQKYLPEVPDFGNPITIRNLIHHTSGLREIYGMLEIAGWKQGDAVRQEEALNLVQSSRELNFPPGSRYAYCNTAYMLLAEIIQKVSGQGFEQWMRENIFQPLDMNDTYVMDIQGEIFPHCADSYTMSDKNVWIKLYDNSTVIGAGGIYTTLPDLARWFNNFRDGKVGGMRAIQQMFQRGILSNGDTLNYAFGLEKTTYRGLQRIQHTGSSAGYRAALLYFPQQDLAIMVKSNYANFNSQASCERIADLLLEDEFTEGPSSFVSLNKPRSEGESPNGPQFHDYPGSYYCPDVETTYTFRVEGDQLIGHHRLNGSFKLQHINGDRFNGPSFLGSVKFERDDTGKVSGMRISNGRVLNLWMSKTTQK